MAIIGGRVKEKSPSPNCRGPQLDVEVVTAAHACRKTSWIQAIGDADKSSRDRNDSRKKKEGPFDSVIGGTAAIIWKGSREKAKRDTEQSAMAGTREKGFL